MVNEGCRPTAVASPAGVGGVGFPAETAGMCTLGGSAAVEAAGTTGVDGIAAGVAGTARTTGSADASEAAGTATSPGVAGASHALPGGEVGASGVSLAPSAMPAGWAFPAVAASGAKRASMADGTDGAVPGSVAVPCAVAKYEAEVDVGAEDVAAVVTSAGQRIEAGAGSSAGAGGTAMAAARGRSSGAAAAWAVAGDAAAAGA
ncbi:hypothetical protein ACFWSF_16625 [Streptomyces sp. NPDC058611]|uniref:hypothetical protein n=1 Tax=unclassified Streptomyces TaxID=2593676 RepID=UPI0036630733